MKFCGSPLLILIASIALTSPAKSAESLDQTISFLIDYVANSKATFIRNGGSYTPAEAAEHIKAKYAHFKKDIRTPEDFIRLSASKSILSGKPYLVRLPDGKEMHLDAWLTDALKQHRSERRS
jgi:Family of unknown function (DUF5329)